MSTLLVNTLTATISRLKLQLEEKDLIIGKLREGMRPRQEGQKASPAAILAAPVTMGALPVYEGVDMACQVDMMGEALEDREHIIERQQAKLDTMLLADKKLAQMQQQQRQLSSSTLALLSKQQRVKVVTAHAVAYTTTKPSEAVRKEMRMAHQRLEEKLPAPDMKGKLQTDITRYIAPHPTNPKPRQVPSTKSQAQKEGQAWITNMLEVTNKLITKYAVPRERRNMAKTKKRPSIVPKQFAAIWQLLLKPPPPLIHVPDPRPSVNWSRLNKNFLKNLPTPHFFAIQGVSQDPSFYTSTAKDYTGKTRLKFADAVELEGAPFGELRGMRTSHGIICMPEGPVHGYVWSETDTDWVIAANTG